MAWTTRCNYPDCGFVAVYPSLDDAETALTRHDFKRHEAVLEATAYLATPTSAIGGIVERVDPACTCIAQVTDPWCSAHNTTARTL